MDPIPLPEYEVAPLDDIAPGVHGLRILFVNVFTVAGAAGGWTLIDSGLYLSAGRIRSWIEEHHGKGARPDGIVLTHGHFDHVGTVVELADAWGVPVYAHEAELPFLTQQEKYPAPDPTVGGGLMAVMSPLYPRTSADLRGRVQALPADYSVPNLPGWRWLHTPGHARGHVSLYHDAMRLLLPGDAFCTTNQESFLAVAKQTPELQGPPTYYTTDWDAAWRSVRELAALRPYTAAPSHGLPIRGDEVAGQLQRLADEFERVAIPEHGRYVRETASGE